MREFRPTPPTGGAEPEDPWAYRPEGRPPAAPGPTVGTGPTPAPGPAAAGPSVTPGRTPGWGAPSGYTHPKGATVLTLGILSVVVLPFLGPFAWAMGHRAIKEVDASGVPAANRSMLVGGMITGIIGTVFLVLGMLVFLAVMGLFVASVSTSVG
ncbi:MAG TPA: DUF4190 domain-containing protein [Ornithinimicrobium sp.]|nr:DUF4190 domain-containing protein [Ornithinimicrobium sp.]